MIHTPDDLHDRPGAHDAEIPLGTVRAQGDVWTWSDSVYAMHGFAPGEVVPTAEVMLAHCHAADRDRLAAVLVADDSELSYAAEQYRLIDARGDEHWVALTVDWSSSDSCMYASMLDLTARHARASADAVTSILTEALESRSIIDQAKGALELVYGTDESTAFNLLKLYSQQTNVKLRTVASEIVDSLSSAHALPTAMKDLFDEKFLDLARNGPASTARPAIRDEARRPIEVTLQMDADVVRIVVTGDVDLATAPAFGGALRSACARASAEHGVVVDLSGCARVGPEGLAELASARRRLTRKSAEIHALVGDETLNPSAVAAVVQTVVVPGRDPDDVDAVQA
ncbi:hypothetical protein DDP54_17520 [Cellulomonas sp. WB94]|uniref:ANTAR domain-containing protein n=1 Tax=Cellulomonas sp. WB94 TaxID=2173174 RepID=UPI000D588E76|nr:ANTAR domain-containing protein [Cellulomonas sp. WB94]PVU81141.1 hypothetical protein DDP54_17520 [Cellulomonas sp. WB94]